MEGAPKFKKTETNDAGYPVYERVNETEREPGELTAEQQEDLSDALQDIGSPNVPKKKPRLTRRGFLTGATALGGAAALGILGKKEESAENEPAFVEPESEPEEVVVELEPEVELIPQSNERFVTEISGYAAFTELQKDEVLFVNESNEPIGQPVEFADFVSEKRNAQGEVVMEEYLYTPGVEDEAGLVEGGIAGEWLDLVQGMVESEFPNETVAKRMNVVADLRAAYSETDEPELVAAIASGEITSYDQVVSYFAEKPVRGAEEYNRMEYAQQAITFRSQEEAGRPAVPESVQAEFCRIIPGLFAQESKFNAGLVSATGARGLAQIMPATWEEYKGTTEVSLSMVEQLEVAGKLISDNYHYIEHFGGEGLQRLQSRFNSVEEYERDLIIPLMINAYNAGGPLIGKLIAEFADQTPEEELSSGKDLFLQFADWAKANNEGVFEMYSEHAREYVSRVYGNAEMLEKKYRA